MREKKQTNKQKAIERIICCSFFFFFTFVFVTPFCSIHRVQSKPKTEAPFHLLKDNHRYELDKVRGVIREGRSQ